MQEYTDQQVKDVEHKARQVEVREMVASLAEVVDPHMVTTAFGVQPETIHHWKMGKELSAHECDQITAAWIGATIITERFDDTSPVQEWLVNERVRVNGDLYAIPVHQAIWRGDQEAVIRSAQSFTPQS